MNASTTTDRERELTEELRTLTAMYEVCTRQRTELAAQNEALKDAAKDLMRWQVSTLPTYIQDKKSGVLK